MKRIILLFTGALVLSIIFTGCKDEEDDSPNNHFKFGDTEYKISNGFLENYGSFRDGAFNLDLTILSSGFTVHETAGEIDSLSGTGDGIYFEIFTSESTKLDVRSYQYDPDGTDAAGTFDFAEIVINWNAQSQEGTFYELNQGTLTILKNEGEYELSFDCKTKSGASVTGYYKGALKYYDYDTRAVRDKEGPRF